MWVHVGTHSSYTKAVENQDNKDKNQREGSKSMRREKDIIVEIHWQRALQNAREMQKNRYMGDTLISTVEAWDVVEEYG